ncbi:MAG TPA: alpha/beta fold hydrolase, partial [Marmoricola sp.]|nr:alpha/beta fold hydrolase [Marmoricola sp.]
MAWILVSLLVPTAARASTLPALKVQTVCLPVVGPDGKSATLFGRRYVVGSVAPRRVAVVLVHGIDSSADTWDLLPRVSPARLLAKSGYVVFAYDRLGFKRSNYAGNPGDLTVEAQQRMLHQVVVDVRQGRYITRSAASCTGAGGGAGSGLRRVVIVGHSSGGLLVAGYPGRFHDVSAMVMANAPSGLPSVNPLGDAALQSALSGILPSAPRDQTGYRTIGSSTHDGPPPTAGPGYTNPLPTRETCENFMLWRTGAVPAAATVLCNPAKAVPTPSAEVNSYPAQILLDQVLVPRTGQTPVLLADSAHDVM